MSLDVKILWVEEDRNWLRGARTCLEEKLRKELALGLDERDAIDSAEQEEREIDAQWVEEEVAQFKGYDMAFIDYQLGGETSGAHFAKKLRDEKKYTEIIFYSANKGEAEKALLDAGLQLSGIYLIGRGQNATPEEFVAECFPIVESILGKILDLTRMRGIMVAEMAGIEMELAELVIGDPRFQLCVDGHDAHALLHGDQEKKIRKAIFNWYVMKRIAKLFAKDEEKFKRFASAAEELRDIRHRLAHVPESKLRDEYNSTDFLKFKQDILKCKRLFKDAFPDPVTPK